MLARFAAIAAVAVLGACAGMEPAGRNADRAPPPPAASAEEMATPTPAPAGQVAAPNVSVATPEPQPAQAQEDDDYIVVPGERERQVPPPGDPRTTAQRVEDIRRWDTCVMQVQNAFDADPMRPQLQSPEEYCRQTLGMTGRLAVPQSRLQQR